ncbi:MAG TPA: preprotein translocase subunit SecG [Pseudomonadales bacterium]|nr:preprotein translocase subunit SecG [Pseudomonadales bacterium]
MEVLITALHILVAMAIIGLILLQQGKGAEMGASFGSGGSQTLFGSAGSGNLLSHATALLVALFFVTSFTLSILAKQKSVLNASAGIPAAAVIEEHNATVIEQQKNAAKKTEAAQAGGDVPAVESKTAPANDVPAAPAPAKQ